jgi:hypothetical protein
MRFTVNLSDNYASGEASQDNCEAYLSFCESNDTLPRTPFTVHKCNSTYFMYIVQFYVDLIRVKKILKIIYYNTGIEKAGIHEKVSFSTRLVFAIITVPP